MRDRAPISARSILRYHIGKLQREGDKSNIDIRLYLNISFSHRYERVKRAVCEKRERRLQIKYIIGVCN